MSTAVDELCDKLLADCAPEAGADCGESPGAAPKIFKVVVPLDEGERPLRLSVDTKVGEVLWCELGEVGEKKNEFRRRCSHWDTRMQKKPNVVIFHIGTHAFDTRFPWLKFSVSSITPEAHVGPHTVGPYSNGYSKVFEGDVWRIRLGKLLARSAHKLPIPHTTQQTPPAREKRKRAEAVGDAGATGGDGASRKQVKPAPAPTATCIDSNQANIAHSMAEMSKTIAAMQKQIATLAQMRDSPTTIATPPPQAPGPVMPQPAPATLPAPASGQGALHQPLIGIQNQHTSVHAILATNHVNEIERMQLQMQMMQNNWHRERAAKSAYMYPDHTYMYGR